MGDYEPGKMNTKDQEQAYDLFWVWSIRTAIGVAAILVLMYTFLT